MLLFSQDGDFDFLMAVSHRKSSPNVLGAFLLCDFHMVWYGLVCWDWLAALTAGYSSHSCPGLAQVPPKF